MPGLDFTLQLIRPANWQQQGKELTFALPENLRESVWSALYRIGEKTNFYYRVRIERPSTPKNTGRGSQHNHCVGHAVQIANEVGEDWRDYLYQASVRAIKRNYPYTTNKWGEVTPKHYGPKTTKEECSILIEQEHEDAAFIPMTLKEDKWEEG